MRMLTLAGLVAVLAWTVTAAPAGDKKKEPIRELEAARKLANPKLRVAEKPLVIKKDEDRRGFFRSLVKL